MREMKDTARAVVRIGYDGRVHKTFRGRRAAERFANEVRVLRYLEERGCPFVPRVIEAHPESLLLITTNCGSRVERVSQEKMNELFAELEKYGVRHNDPFDRNVTYRATDGRFCLIDFEFATTLEDGVGLEVMEERKDPDATADGLAPGAAEGGSAGAGDPAGQAKGAGEAAAE